jgi:hypothetical protein
VFEGMFQPLSLLVILGIPLLVLWPRSFPNREKVSPVLSLRQESARKLPTTSRVRLVLHRLNFRDCHESHPHAEWDL